MTTVVTSESIFTTAQLEALDPSKLPQHIAFIPDGNRRWAKQNRLDRELGHRKGANNLMEIVKAAKQIGVSFLTFYLFSTENWTRPRREVETLMWMLKSYLVDERENLIENNVKLQTIGDLSRLPNKVLVELDKTLKATEDCTGITVIFALNYGSRDEIRRAMDHILDDYEQGRITRADLSEELISQHLDTYAWPDPDLLIRTSGELRVSNFLLWQISYAEVHVSPVLWPEFTPDHLLEAICNFQHRERRLGV